MPFSEAEQGRLILSASPTAIGSLRNWPSPKEHQQGFMDSSGLPCQIKMVAGLETGDFSTAVIIGDHKTLRDNLPLVRIESGCLWSKGQDIRKSSIALAAMNESTTLARVPLYLPPEFHECDCDAQSLFAQEKIEREGGVLIVVPRDEARGAGIEFKRITSYFQHHYNMRLDQIFAFFGVPFEQRIHTPEANFLRKALGFHTIRLLTHNPSNILEMEREGLTVIREDILITGPWNHELEAKRHAGYMNIPSFD